jgi:hypothetical protein
VFGVRQHLAPPGYPWTLTEAIWKPSRHRGELPRVGAGVRHLIGVAATTTCSAADLLSAQRDSTHR